LIGSQVVAKQPKVLLIGVDGLRSDAVQATPTPVLDGLAKVGVVDWGTSVISPGVSQSDTVSGPGWTTFLTGTWADRHGVLDNTFKGRDRKRAPHCFELAKQRRSELKTASLVCWLPLQDHVTNAADINVIVRPIPSESENGQTSWAEADRTLVRLACDTLRNEPVDFVFVYIGAVDVAGHRHGFHPSVSQYTEAIEVADQQIGELTQTLTQRKSSSDEDWLIIISTDHGGKGTGHSNGREDPNVFQVPMIVSGEAAAGCGCQLSREAGTVDVVAVALTHLGVPLNPDWELAGSAKGWLSE